MADPGLNLNYAMVVHGEQRFELRAAAARRRRGDRPGHDLRHQERGPQLGDDDDHADRYDRWRARLHRYRDAGRARRCRVKRMTGGRAVSYDEVEVGAEIAAVEYPVTRLSLVKYCGASGDFNVIHWNERIAKAVGLPDVIAHGMFTMAEAGRFVTDWAGPKAVVLEFGVRFSAPVVVPDDDVGADDQRQRPGRGEAGRQQGRAGADRQVRRHQGADQGPGRRPPATDARWLAGHRLGECSSSPSRCRCPATPRCGSAVLRRGSPRRARLTT